MIIQILSKTQWLAKCHGKWFDSWLHHIQISIATSGFSFNHLFFIRWNSVGFYWLFCMGLSASTTEIHFEPYRIIVGPPVLSIKAYEKAQGNPFFFKRNSQFQSIKHIQLMKSQQILYAVSSIHVGMDSSDLRL